MWSCLMLHGILGDAWLYLKLMVPVVINLLVYEMIFWMWCVDLKSIIRISLDVVEMENCGLEWSWWEALRGKRVSGEELTMRENEMLKI